jgi:hypothetical protein
MSLTDRIAKLEDALHPDQCPECGAGGEIVLGPLRLSELTGDAPPRPDPRKCPQCGRWPIQLGPLKLDSPKGIMVD